MNFLSDADIERFWSKVDRRGADECWPWTAKARSAHGYGLLKHRSGRNIVASRIACWLGHGNPPIPNAKSLHSCDNPPCCNPAHLRWGTQLENVADAVERSRHSPPPRNAAYRRRDTQPKGADVWNQTLTERTVREIWRLHLIGGINVTQIAERTGTKRHAVADVVRGKSWRHLKDAPTLEQLKAGGVRRGSNGFNALAQERALAARRKGGSAH